MRCNLPQGLLKHLHRLPAGDQVALVDDDGGHRVEQEEVFSERMSILFKRLRIVRMVDAPRNTLVYLTYSEKLIDGSPQNSITAVPISRSIAIPLKK